MGLSKSGADLWAGSGLNFTLVESDTAFFLGSPLGKGGVDEALRVVRAELTEVGPRLCRLSSHEAFYLLKASFGMPRLQYILRCSPTFDSTELKFLSDGIRELLSVVLNIQLGDEAWAQASLPVRWGGLGIRDVTQLAASSFLSSLAATAQLVQRISPQAVQSGDSPLRNAAMISWSRMGGTSPPVGEEAGRQRSWDDPVCSAILNQLLTRADRTSRARLLAVSSPDAGVWIHTLPIRNLGLCLSDREIRVAAGLRLGAQVVRQHTCVCLNTVDIYGHHGLACRRSAGRHRRHAMANDVLVRAIRAVEVHAELEPHLLLSDKGKRADGATLEPWSMGKTLVWDFTCPDTLAPSHVAQSSAQAGSAAAVAEQNKRLKYSELVSSNSIIFFPVSIETLGTWGASARALCRDIGSRLAARTGDPRSHHFLIQRMAVAVQRGNALPAAGTCPSQDMS